MTHQHRYHNDSTAIPNTDETATNVHDCLSNRNKNTDCHGDRHSHFHSYLYRDINRNSDRDSYPIHAANDFYQ